MGINVYAENEWETKYCNFDCFQTSWVGVSLWHAPQNYFVLQVIASKCVNMLKRLMNPAEDYL